MRTNQALFCLVFAAGVFWAVWFVFRNAVQRRAPWAWIAAATLDVLCGLGCALLGGAHLFAVLSRAVTGRGVQGAAEFRYEFPFYALALVGCVIVIPGLLCLRHARGLTCGEAGAWKGAFWAAVVLLGVNLPLIPIQGFASLLSGLAFLNFVGLTATRGRFQVVAASAESK